MIWRFLAIVALGLFIGWQSAGGGFPSIPTNPQARYAEDTSAPSELEARAASWAGSPFIILPFTQEMLLSWQMYYEPKPIRVVIDGLGAPFGENP